MVLAKPALTIMNAQRVSILVAEDSEDNRFLLEAYCRGTAYDLTFAEDGEKAVAAYQAGAFALVIMDVQMPVMDGLTATRMIRSFEARRGAKRTPILALTANVMPHDVVLAHEAGCDVHLPKPISRKGFLGALEEWKPQPPNVFQMNVRPRGGQVARELLEDNAVDDDRERKGNSSQSTDRKESALHLEVACQTLRRVC